MKLKFIKRLLMGVAVLYAPLQAMAWGAEGHRVAGQIAESYLTPKARKAVEEILNGQSIAMESNWADFIKSDPAYSYLSSWHYVDFDKAYDYQQMQDFLAHDTNTDAYTKIQFVTAELKKKDISKENRLLYLRMLIHMVEDIHQPMHAAHTEDKGGNDIKVTWGNNAVPTNLHAVWDSQIIESQQLSYTEYAAWINHTTAAQRAEWQKEPIAKWLFDSHQIAEKLYAETKNGDTLNPYKYNFNHIETVNQQLLKAGVHLAGVLNEIFG